MTRKIYAKNAAKLEQMAAKALSTGRPVNGYLERELTAAAATYRAMAKAPAEVAADMAKVGWNRAMARLAELQAKDGAL